MGILNFILKVREQLEGIKEWWAERALCPQGELSLLTQPATKICEHVNMMGALI